VLLVKRKIPPFAGAWALPGGFQDYEEDPAATAVREVAEETGLVVTIRRLIDVFYSVDDPRKRVNVIAYLASPVAGELRAADDAADARFSRSTRCRTTSPSPTTARSSPGCAPPSPPETSSDWSALRLRRRR